jgi:hypothetical protein
MKPTLSQRHFKNGATTPVDGTINRGFEPLNMKTLQKITIDQMTLFSPLGHFF